MKDKAVIKYRSYLIIFAIYLGMLAVSWLSIYLSNAEFKNFDLFLLALFIIVHGAIFFKKYREACVYRNKEKDGVVLLQPRLPFETIVLGIATILLIAYHVIIYFTDITTHSSFLTCIALLVNAYLCGYTYPLVILNSQEIYFKKRWIPYKEIHKIDTDKSSKRRVVVYLYTNQCYSSSMPTSAYERFHQEMKTHGFTE